MTVTLNGAASSSSSGSYAPVAAASCMWACRASADSQSGDLDQDIGVIEHLVPGAAEEPGMLPGEHRFGTG